MSLTKVKAGNIILTTPAANSNDVTPATTQYVTTAVANLIDSAPSNLNTLNELAAAMSDNASFFSTVLPLSGGTMTGNIAHGGSLTLDVVGNISLDADDAGHVRFKDGGSQYASIYKTGSGFVIDGTGNLTLNVSGNYGFGQAPVAFRNNSDEVGLQFGKRGVLFADTGLTTDIANNTYVTSSNTRVAMETDIASYYQQYQGVHKWFSAPSVSAGATQTFSEAMRIDQNGKVGIGATSPGSLLHLHNDSVSGNTQLHIHNNKTGDAAVLKLEGKRTSLNDTGQIIFVNNGNLVAKIDARSAADDGELRFFTSATGSGSGISQRMVIDGSGKISIGNNNPVWSGSYGGGLFLKGNNSTSDRYARLAIVDSTGAETSSGNLTLANNGVVTINREVNGSGSTSYENILKISRTGGATNNGQREAAISFFDSDNATYTAMITGVRTSPAGNYNGGLSIYTNSHAQNANASSISEMVSGKAVHFDASQSATFYGDIYINGANDKLQQNGVGRIAKAGVINGNQTVSYTVEHSNQSSLHIRCAMQHYGIMTSYGTALDGVYGNGSGGLFSVLVTQHTTATSGSWSVTRVDSDTLTITKNAGNYAGGGYYYIIVEGANLV